MARRTLRSAGCAALLVVCFALPVFSAQKVIIDTDPGVDDAIAILFAFQVPELEILAFTSTFGNVETKLATLNSLRLVEMSGKHIPVAEGAVRPLYMKKLPSADFVHGQDGFGNVRLPAPTQRRVDQSAAELIVEIVKAHPGEVTLIALGPMTNIALALLLEPELPRYVQAVVAMGGVLHVTGNVSPVASANILNDPHAADIVLGTDWDVTLVPGDTTRQVRITDSFLESVRDGGGARGKFLHDMSLFYRDFYRSVGVTDGFYAHDPTAMAFVVDPGLFETEERATRVVTDGMAIGEVIAATERHWSQPGPWHDMPKAKITTTVDSERLLKLLEDALLSR